MGKSVTDYGYAYVCDSYFEFSNPGIRISASVKQNWMEWT